MHHKRSAIAIVLILGIVFCLFSAAAVEYQYAQVKTVKGPLNMREAPSGKAVVLAEIPQDAYLQVAPYDDTWCSTVYNGKTGYVMTKYLAFVDVLSLRELSQNASGKDVLAVNERLRELNYFGEDTVIGDSLGAETAERIKLFQAMQGMEVTGTLTQQQQALLLWAPVENLKLAEPLPDGFVYDGERINVPDATPAPAASRTMTVSVSAVCSGYNHVGNSWSQYFSINGEKVKKGDKVTVTLGDSLEFYAKITEKDSKPDVGKASETRVISQEDFENGFTVSLTVSVRENGGRYSGNKAVWTVTFKLTP